MNTSSSGDLPGSPPPTDKEREMKRDAGKTEDRDLEHGEGGTLGLELRFRSSQTIAATPDANFGIKGALAPC